MSDPRLILKDLRKIAFILGKKTTNAKLFETLGK